MNLRADFTGYVKTKRDLSNIYGSKLFEVNDLIWHDHYNYGLIIQKDCSHIVIAFEFGIRHFRIDDMEEGIIEQATDKFLKEEPLEMWDAKGTKLYSTDEFIEYMKEHKQRQFKNGYIKITQQ